MKNPLKGPNKCFSQVKKNIVPPLQNPRDVNSYYVPQAYIVDL